MNFRDFQFESSLQEGLDAMGFEKPTPIQEQAIPIILQGHDLIACAQTGTGKTAAYVLPVIHRIAQSDHSHLNTLIIAPTRELAQQIDQQIEGFSYFSQVSSIPIYGGGDGMAWEQQKRALREGADIIIATPGRLISLISGGDVNFSRLKHLILDEADRMLDMGFYDDIVRIIRALPRERQTLLFSATMPPKIRNMAREFLNNPQEVTIAVSRPADKIHQVVHFIHDEQKIPMAVELLKDPVHQSVIVFASTKEAVKKLNLSLRKAGLRTAAFHSDLEQAQREELMRDFKARNLRVLVGTDVLSRGIDVEGIGMVLNFDVPPDPEDYIHRIGRTARADETGLAITFVNHRDLPRFRRIEQLIGHPLDASPIPAHLGAAPDFSAEAVREKRSGNKNKRPFYRKKKGGTAGNAGS